jgi:PAS domain S-box-containing protein
MPDGRFTLVNAAFERLVGRPRAEILGRTDHDLFPRERADAFRANDAEVLRRGDTRTAEEDAPGADGRVRTYLSAKFPLPGAGGRVGVAGISTDVTAEREAERARRESEARLALALDAAGLGTFHWDLVSGTHAWDDRLYAVYGVAPGTPVTDAVVFARVHPEDRARVLAEGARALDPAAEAPGGAPPMREPGERRYAVRHRVVRPGPGSPGYPEDARHEAAGHAGAAAGGAGGVDAVRHVAVVGRVTFVAGDGVAASGGGTLHAVRVSGTVQDVTEQAEAEAALAARAADQAFLLDLVGRLALLAEPDAVGRAAAAALGERLRLARCFFADVDTAREVYDIGAMEYDDGAHPPPAGAFPVAAFGPHVGDDARAGRPTVVADTAADPRTAPFHAAVYGPQRVGAYVHLPLRRGGAWVAALLLDTAAPRAWTDAEVALAREVAERAWAAVETARLATAERSARLEAEAAALLLQEQAIELEAANEELRAVAAELEERTEAAEAAHVQAQSAYVEAERQRRDAERHRADAERANRARAEFLATMSHELRTPLNAIQGYVQLVEQELYGPVTDGQRQALGRVGRAQAHLLGLVTDVLNFTRLEEGRVAFDVREVAVADVVRDVVPLVAPQLAAKGLALDVALPDDAGAPVRVWADREKLGQLLLNLLANAVKFTPATRADGTPGRVGIALAGRAESLGGDAPGGGNPAAAYLRVYDTGIGISRDQQARIFEPFVQVSTGLTRTAEGTGLGLAISRDLARGMGGDLTAESAPGAGSTFTVTLRGVAAADGTPVDRRARDERRAGDRRRRGDRRQDADDRTPE